MVWACTKEGCGGGGGECWGWKCQVEEREGGRGGDIDVVRDVETIRVTGRMWKTGGKRKI